MKIEIEKPVVPQWFDDWYKTFDGNKPVALYHLNRTGWGYGLTDDNDCEVDGFADKLKDLFGDFSYGDAQEYLSKAILLGYEVKKEPLYYAKIKGWKLATSKSTFWNYRSIIESPMLPRLYTGDKEDKVFVKTKMTMEKWNGIGINGTNADFERVE